MVSSGLTFQRVILRTVFTLLSLVSEMSLRAQPADIAGTMPEDYLPELKPILATALKQAPETILKEFERLAADARLDFARSARLPQLGGSFNYGITETATASDTSSKTRDNGFFYSFGLNQAIFHWGALKNQHDSARINVLIQDRSFALAYRELSVLLRKAYLALVVERSRLKQAREGKRLVEDDIAVATAKKDSGILSSAVLEGEKLRLRETTLELSRAEAEFLTNRERFRRLAGLMEFPEDKIPNAIPRPAYSEPSATVMAATLLRDNAKSTLEYEIYKLRVDEAVLRQKIEATRLLPKIGASAGYSLENTTNVNGNLAEQRAVARQTLGIGGSWNIFDGFATRGAKREALVARRTLEHKRAMDIEQLLQLAQTLERSLKLDAEQLDLSDIRRDLAVEGHRRIAEEVRFGNLPRGEAERARYGILQADAKSVESRAAFLGRWSEFVSIAGHDPVLENLPARYVRDKK